MKFLYKNPYWKLNKKYDLNKILYLLIDRPSRITSWNAFLWYDNKGQRHRNYDLPTYANNNCGGVDGIKI